MAQWKDTDAAGNSVIWGPALLNKTPNVGNQTTLYNNTTANAFVTGVTVGQYGIDTNEEKALRAGANGRPAHAGWVLRKEGMGGRAGRVQYEVLVAMGSMTGDGSDDTLVPDYYITFTSQPANASGSNSNNAVVTFTVGAASVPAGLTLTYAWQVWNGSGFEALSDAGAYSNTATATLSVLANTAANGSVFRAAVANTSAVTVYSTNATFTKLT